MEKEFLDLDVNEYIIYEREEQDVMFQEEEVQLYITNLNIILVDETTPMFKKSTFKIIKWSIEDIKVIDNIPQVTIEHSEDSYWNIAILFTKGLKRLGIYYGSRSEKNEVKKNVELLVDNISQLRLTGTIVLKRNASANEERYEPAYTNKSNIFKNTLIGKKISGGLNIIKEAVKPQEKEKKEAVQVSKTYENMLTNEKANSQPAVDKQFNYCPNYKTKKNINTKFCPECGTAQEYYSK